MSAVLIERLRPIEDASPPKTGCEATMGRRNAEVIQFAAIVEGGREPTMAGRAVLIIVMSSAVHIGKEQRE